MARRTNKSKGAKGTKGIGLVKADPFVDGSAGSGALQPIDFHRYAVNPQGNPIKGKAYERLSQAFARAKKDLPDLATRGMLTVWQIGDRLRPLHEALRSKEFAQIATEVFTLSPRSAYNYLKVREAFESEADIPTIRGAKISLLEAEKIVREKTGKPLGRPRGSTANKKKKKKPLVALGNWPVSQMIEAVSEALEQLSLRETLSLEMRERLELLKYLRNMQALLPTWILRVESEARETKPAATIDVRAKKTA